MSTDEEMKKENQKKEEKKEIEVLEEKYEREDSETGYAQSMQETNLLKANRKYEVIANNLMGKYDENGHYTISQEILQELMLLKKIVGVKLENGLELKAFYKDLTFEFLLKFNGIDEEKAEESATLFLIERIEKVNGYIINKLLTSVGTYTAKTGEHFKDFCFQAFHVVKNVDDTSMGCLVGDALNIDKRIAYLLAVREASRNLYIELEEQYFNRRIAILDSIPQGTLILSEFAKKRALLEKYFIGNDRNKFRALNELLTSILESNPNIMAQMPVLDVMMTPLNSKYLESTLAISEKIKISEKYKALENFSLPVALPKPMVGVIKVATEGKKPAPKPKQSAPKKSAGGGKKSGAGGGGSKGGSSKKKGGNDKKKDNKDKKKGPKGPGLGFVKTSSKPEKKEETKKQKVSSLKFNTSKAEPKKEEQYYRL